MSDESAWESVARLVFPFTAEGQVDEEVLPLYVLDWTVPHQSDVTLDPRIDLRKLDFTSLNQSRFSKLMHSSLEGLAPATTASYSVLSRSSVQIHAGKKTSFCTFFSAFPGGYWTRWTHVSTVRLTIQATGKGTITVLRSDGRGLFTTVHSQSIDSNQHDSIVTIEIPLTGMLDGGYVWFDAEADVTTPLVLSDCSWQVPLAQHNTDTPHTISLAITTFNRPTYCLNQLRVMGQDANLHQRLDTIYCIDQGQDCVDQQPGFQDVATALGPSLSYFHQKNLGGSGGFARGMYETLIAHKSYACMLLDDDAISEPESILRAIQFSDYTTKPFIIGGGMFHLDDRTSLFSSGECIDWKRMWYYPALGLPYNHDFALEPLRDCPELHQRVDEDYNGWWMCLIPCQVIQKIGLPLPVFIKFDDIEYGLRAQKAEIATISLPGVAVWHQAWHEKDQTRTWEEYFAERNRFLTMLLHEPHKPTTRVMLESFFDEINLGLRLQYSSMALRHLALQDLLQGPQHLLEIVSTRLKDVNELRSQFTDAQTKPRLDDFPSAYRQAMPTGMNPTSGKDRRIMALKGVVTGILHSMKRSASTCDDRERPEVEIAAHNTSWMSFAGINSALVTSPDGNSVAWLKRDNKEFAAALKKNYQLTQQLIRQWDQLSAAYRNAHLTSVETWEAIFGLKQ
ncbi:MAG: glycosyltransferase [Aeriscardovia sp.]|nr:glycosyltransferase [Aeriscardovia sp.]